MQNVIKGRIKLNGVDVELEASSPTELANIINQLANGRSTTPRRAQKNVTQAQVTRQEDQKKKRTLKAYLRWQDEDVVAIARLAGQFGESGRGFSAAAYRYIRANGVNKERDLKSVSVMAGRIFRFVHTGETMGMNEKTLEQLSSKGITAPKRGFFQGKPSLIEEA